MYNNSDYWTPQYFYSSYWGTEHYDIPEIPDTGDSEEVFSAVRKLDYAKIFKDDDEILEILMMIVDLL